MKGLRAYDDKYLSARRKSQTKHGKVVFLMLLMLLFFSISD